jgi:hypothetical protein
MVPSNEIFRKLCRFKAGVKIVLIQDSCHASSFKDFEAIEPLACELIVVASCTEQQFAMDGGEHGAFTSHLLKVWSNGNFIGGYKDLISEIGKRMEAERVEQTPQLYLFGSDKEKLANDTPFSPSNPGVSKK